MRSLLARIAGWSPEFSRLRDRAVALEASLRDSEMEVSSLRDLNLRLTEELAAGRKALEESEARSRILYEKWIDYVTNRGVFGHGAPPGPEASQPEVKLPAGRLISLQEAKRKNRQFIKQLRSQ